MPLASAPAMGAQSQETVVAQSTGDKQPGCVAWYDSADGKTSNVDDKFAQSVITTFANAQYMITDAAHLLLLPAGASGSNVQPLLPLLDALDASNNQGLYYLVHGRSGSLFVNGVLLRDQQAPTQGLAMLDLVLLDNQGNSESVHLEQGHAWASNQGTGSGGSGRSSGGNTNPFGTH